MFDYPWIVLAARRMGLRDKGRVQSLFKHLDEDGFPWSTTRVCCTCATRIRIGIEKRTGWAVKYCWRCEVKWPVGPTPPPQEKEPIPVPEQKAANVIPFPGKKSA